MIESRKKRPLEVKMAAKRLPNQYFTGLRRKKKRAVLVCRNGNHNTRACARTKPSPGDPRVGLMVEKVQSHKTIAMKTALTGLFACFQLQPMFRLSHLFTTVYDMCGSG